MEETVLRDEPLVRLTAFLAVLAALACAESLFPRRRLRFSKLGRWGANLGLTLLDMLLVRAAVLLAAPVAAAGMASVAREHGFGLFNAVALPSAAAVPLAVVLLDLGIYGQHVVFHAVPFLWRFHRVHHADLDIDVTTGTRFHPGEILMSLGIKVGLVALLGPPVVAVVAFEVLLNATSMFSHSNLRFPAGVDRVLRWFVVTPDMHRVHHSAVPSETDANFGFNVPWWDLIFGTYKAQPDDGHDGMKIGLRELRDPARLTLLGLIVLPFASRPSGGEPSMEQRPESLVPRASGESP